MEFAEPPPQTPSDPIESVFEALRNDTLVSIFIGSDPKPIRIPQSIICGASNSLKTALVAGMLQVPENERQTWKIFAYWLVKGKIPKLDLDDDTLQLITAWGFGDKWAIPRFQDDIMIIVFDDFIYSEAKDAFSLCHEGSVMRRFLAERLVTGVEHSQHRTWDQFPGLLENASYCKDLMEATNARRNRVGGIGNMARTQTAGPGG